MTNQPRGSSVSRWHATFSLVAGLVSFVALVLFFALPGGPAPLAAAAFLGGVAIVFGIIALRRHQSKGSAITGIVTGAFSFLLSAGIYVFALLFIGAIPL